MRIEARLAELGVTQAELARRAGLPQTTVNSLIRGDRRSTSHLVVLARALETSPDFLAGVSTNANHEPPPWLTAEELLIVRSLRRMQAGDRDIVKSLVAGLLKRRDGATASESPVTQGKKRAQAPVADQRRAREGNGASRK